MTILCRPRPRDWGAMLRKTWPAARPSLRAVSAVTGSMLAVPRTPSVPKIFFVWLMDYSVFRWLADSAGTTRSTVTSSGTTLTTVTFVGVWTFTLFWKAFPSFTSVRLTNAVTYDTFKLFRTEASARTVTVTFVGVIVKPRISVAVVITVTGKVRETVLGVRMRWSGDLKLSVILEWIANPIKTAEMTETTFHRALLRM